jgi:hypothetical protein
LGPRQVGKTTLARTFAQEHFPNDTIFFDLENPTDLARLENPFLAFSNIPQNYGDLVIALNVGPNSEVATIILQFNGDTGSTSYSYVSMLGNGSTTASNSGTQDAASLGYVLGTGQYMSVGHVMDYSSSDKHKTILVRHANPSREASAVTNRWANTAPVTSLRIAAAVSNFASGSTFSLYGIAA